MIETMLIAALQIGAPLAAQDTGVVPVTVMIVASLPEQSANAVILRRGSGRDVILLSEEATSRDLVSAVEQYRELYAFAARPAGGTTRIRVTDRGGPRRSLGKDSHRSLLAQLHAQQPRAVAGAGVGRATTIWVKLPDG